MASERKALKATVIPADDAPGAPAAGPVLVATTPSDRGRRALSAASSFCARTGRPLTACRVLEGGRFAAESESALAELSAGLRQHLASNPIPCEAEVIAYPPHYNDAEYGRAVCIVDAATEKGAELIVIGPHDLGAGRKVLGSTMTQRLLQYAPCPVLIAANDPARAFGRVLIAVDFSPVSFEAVEQAMRLAPGAEIHTVYVNDPKSKEPFRDSEGGRESLDNLVGAVIAEAQGRGELSPADPLPTVIHHIVEGAPAAALAEVVAEVGPDLMVLGTRGRTGLARAILGSVAARFIDEPPCDLLVLRSPQA